MKIYNLKNIPKKRLEIIRKRSMRTSEEASSIVRGIISDVRKLGDKAIYKKYSKRIKKGKYLISVSNSEIKKSYEKVSPAFLEAVKQAVKNITAVTQEQFETLTEKTTETCKDIRVWREWRPIEKVGLYIPGGKAIYPSSLLMTGIPAIIAGCKNIVVCSPPNEKGEIPAPTLVAADIIGIKKIYKVGGAEAIGAMAYGTQTVPSVYKIFGAGNSYVTEAKMQVLGKVNIDMPAGPSEIFIIADDSANPSFIAADLLADGEHGDDSACVLITTSERLAYLVREELNRQIKTLETGKRIKKALKNYGLIAVAESLDQAVAFCNDYAPEHLEIMTKNADALVSQITNAGSVFIGDWTTKSAGDYATGANHVLPTGGMAKMFGPLSVESFGKQMQIQKVVSEKALKSIRQTVETFGEIENLPAHKNSMSIRFERKNL